LREHCLAHAAGLQHVLPVPRPRKVRPHRSAYLLILQREDGAVLLEQRPPTGVWGGLWAFPQFDARETALQWAGAGRQAERELAAYQHAFTHFDLTLYPLVVAAVPHHVADAARALWYDPRRPARIGLAKPTLDLIEILPAPSPP
jgi:A/G-specific adenine glycosylase